MGLNVEPAATFRLLPGFRPVSLSAPYNHDFYLLSSELARFAPGGYVYHALNRAVARLPLGLAALRLRLVPGLFATMMHNWMPWRNNMQIPVLVEPVANNGFRAKDESVLAAKLTALLAES